MCVCVCVCVCVCDISLAVSGEDAAGGEGEVRGCGLTHTVIGVN